MERAYSVLIVKAMNEETREFSGIATTPEMDTMGDIIESSGIAFQRNPVPLLWNHKHDMPVGEATFGVATADGIPFSAKIPDVKEAGIVKDMVDRAWHSVKHGLIRAVSIGATADPKDVKPLKTGGRRILKALVHELSLATVPANSSALITAVKSIDNEALAASGLPRGAVRLEASPGVSGNLKTAHPGAVKLNQ